MLFLSWSVCVFCFFFKQKTEYEMRISDWVQTCALPIWIEAREKRLQQVDGQLARDLEQGRQQWQAGRRQAALRRVVGMEVPGRRHQHEAGEVALAALRERSEERRVGKECVRTFSSRWEADH